MTENTKKIIEMAKQLQTLLNNQKEVLAVRLDSPCILGGDSSYIQFSGYNADPSKFTGWEVTATGENATRKETPLCDGIRGVVYLNTKEMLSEAGRD